MTARILGAPTLPIDKERVATLAAVQQLYELAPRPTLTLWFRDRISWESWRPYWNIRRDP